MNAKKFEVKLGTKVGEKKATQKSTTADQPTALPPSGIPEPMTLEQIAATPPDQRRQLNCGVPEELWLHRRTAIYREDHGLGATRQNIVALAVDEWLRSRGY